MLKFIRKRRNQTKIKSYCLSGMFNVRYRNMIENFVPLTDGDRLLIYYRAWTEELHIKCEQENNLIRKAHSWRTIWCSRDAEPDKLGAHRRMSPEWPLRLLGGRTYR